MFKIGQEKNLLIFDYFRFSIEIILECKGLPSLFLSRLAKSGVKPPHST